MWWLFQLFLPSGPTLYPLLWELSLDIIRPVDLSDSKANSSLLDWFNWSDKTWLYFSWLGDCLYFIWSHGDQTWSTTWKTILSNSSHVIDYPCGLWSDQTRSDIWGWSAAGPRLTVSRVRPRGFWPPPGLLPWAPTVNTNFLHSINFSPVTGIHERKP